MKAVEVGDYGYVVGLKGKFKDKVVYYDDDDDNETKIIVYPGSIVEGYSIVPRASFRPASIGEVLLHEQEAGLYTGSPLFPRRPQADASTVATHLTLRLLLKASGRDSYENNDPLETFPPDSAEGLLVEGISKLFLTVLRPTIKTICSGCLSSIHTEILSSLKTVGLANTSSEEALSQPEVFTQLWQTAWDDAIREWASNIHPLFEPGEKAVKDGLNTSWLKITDVDTTRALYTFEDGAIVSWDLVEVATIHQRKLDKQLEAMS